MIHSKEKPVSTSLHWVFAAGAGLSQMQYPTSETRQSLGKKNKQTKAISPELF